MLMDGSALHVVAVIRRNWYMTAVGETGFPLS